MGTIRLQTNPYLVSPGTTRLIAVTTGAGQLIQLGTGYHALELVNAGSPNLYYGDSNLSVGSGTILYIQNVRYWSGLDDGWSVYVRAGSAATQAVVHEWP